VDKFSATIQALSKQYSDKTWTPRIEWAFAKYSLLDNLEIRAGRIRPAVYALSDFLDVNFTNPWVRPPIEQYSTFSITHLDGADVLWHVQTGPISWLVQPYFGSNSAETPANAKLDADAVGLNLVGEISDFSFRAGYLEAEAELYSSTLQGTILAGLGKLCQFGDVGACQQAVALHLDSIDYKFLSLGSSWDNGSYFVAAEWSHAITNTTLVPNSVSWYLSAGVHLDKWTPYISYADFDSQSPSVYNGGIIPNTNLIVTSLLQGNTQSQHTIAIGVRYDLRDNVAIKAQWDRVATQCKAPSAGTCDGLFINKTPVFDNNAQDVNLLSLSVDFIY
jgi:hypothetical protein